MSRVKINKEIAQQRMNEMLNNEKFEIVTWSGTNKPVTVKCKICGELIDFKKGQSIYIRKNKYGGFNGECNTCKRYIYALLNIEKYKEYIKVCKDHIESDPKNSFKYTEKIKEYNERIEKQKQVISNYLLLINEVKEDEELKRYIK